MSEPNQMGMRITACGHKVAGFHMCDDLCRITSGTCYLLIFNEEDREKVWNDLGPWPMAIDLCDYIDHHDGRNLETHPVNIYKSHGENLLHATIETSPLLDRAVSVYIDCSFCGTYKQGETANFVNKRRLDCLRCSQPGSEMTHVIKMCYLHCRIGGNSKVDLGFSIRDLLLKYSPVASYSCPEPNIHRARDALIPETSTVFYSGDKVSVTLDKSSVEIDRHSQRLRSITHDFVASRWKGETDTPLSVVGVTGPASRLTPDYLIPETKCILELATCNSDSEKSLRRAYESKILHYEGELRQYPVRYFILVVSPQYVLTNIDISERQVNCLTQRYRNMKPLEDSIEQVTGLNVFETELDEMSRYVKYKIESESLTFVDNKEGGFVKADIDSCADGMSESDRLNVFSQFKDSWNSTKHFHTSSEQDLHDYLKSFNLDNTRSDLKRISNVPFMLPGYPSSKMDYSIEPEFLSKLWAESTNVTGGYLGKHINDDDFEKIICNKIESKLHENKKKSTFKPRLSGTDSLELAMTGVGAKAYKDNEIVKAKRHQGKKSFHPETKTDDIEEFLELNFFMDKGKNRHMSEDLEIAVEVSKNLSTSSSSCESLAIWRQMNRTAIMHYSMMMSNIFLELSYCYKHWTNKGSFMVKRLSSGVEMLIYNPKNTLFVSFAFPRDGCTIWDTGRLGPKIYSSTTHHFTDFSSYDNAQLEHFIKFGPYMGALFVHLNSASKSELGVYSKYCKSALPHLLLMYCNNKTDCEELVTSQRYLFMKLLEDVGTSPYTFVSRLPSVMRSRLTVYYLKRTIDLMKFYSLEKIKKSPYQSDDMILYKYLNIKSLFSGEYISLEEKINEFYFGYVVSKEINPTSDKTFKVLTKLIKQEHKFRDKVSGSMFVKGADHEDFKVNLSLIKHFSHRFSAMLEDKFGVEFKAKILKDVVHTLSRATFSDLATLKVSSRDHSEVAEFTETEGTTQELKDAFQKERPSEVKKRPYCMEALTSLISEYKVDTGLDPNHLIDLIFWSAKSLLKQGFFNSDQFNKSQHGGEREIHVLEMRARLAQYFVETVSRTMCTYFESETTQNPKYKERFVREHYARSEREFGKEYTTVSKSADATTWCQFHHTSHFAAMLRVILPSELHSLVIPILSLWPKKRLTFPIAQAAILMHNKDLRTDNTTFQRFKDEFLTGTGMFVSKASNTIEVRSGMFQGILHATSSLYHCMIQEVMKEAQVELCKRVIGIANPVMTVIEGSDDSGEMISLPGKASLKNFVIAKRLLLWKERLSPRLAVYCNEAKSSIGTHDLVEYNSEWFPRHSTVKPTFRWVSACMTTTVTERFIDRVRIMSDLVTDCLTGGSSTLECAVIQLYQATFHYQLLGLGSPNRCTRRYVDLLESCPDPLYGFFPMDFDVSCGIPGVEFNLYTLAKLTNYGYNIRSVAQPEVTAEYSHDELPNYLKVKDLTTVKLKFTDMKIFYRVVERMKVQSLQSAIEAANTDPEILFRKTNKWADEQITLVLKLFSLGVKESISNKSPSLRLAASSAYLLTQKCFTSSSFPDNKCTLLYLMENNKAKIKESMSRGDTKDPAKFFTHSNEFESLLSSIRSLQKNLIAKQQNINRTSKVKLQIISKPSGDINLIELCKRKWFGLGNVPLSRGQFDRKWDETVKTIPFLSSSVGVDGLRETASNLKMNVVQTKSFLESLSTRARAITLHDTASRSGSLSYSMSRTYWPNVKLINLDPVKEEMSTVRSRLFSIATYWFKKEKKTDLIKHAIRTAPELSGPWESVPNRLKRLKIMRDLLDRGDKLTLLNRIQDLKQGTLGAFTKVQKGLGNSRSGEGVWQGTVCGISVQMDMRSNICTRIIVNSLHDTISLGLQLKELMTAFKLNLPSVEDVTVTTTAWLDHKGRIMTGSKPKGVPIFQERELRFNMLENLERAAWEVDVNFQNVRIRAVDLESEQRITILSDTLTSSDWMPGVEVLTSDPLFRNWAMGRNCSLAILEQFVSPTIPSNRAEFADFSRQIHNANREKDSHKYRCKNDNYFRRIESLGWDMSAFQLVLRDYVGKRRSEKLAQGSNIDISESGLQKLDPVLALLTENMLWDDTDDFSKEFEMWADEVEDEVDRRDKMLESEFGTGAVDSEELPEIETALRLFSGAQEEGFYETILKEDLGASFRMPAYNRFFSSLDPACIAYCEQAFKEVACSDINAPGVIGSLLSLCSGVYRIGLWGPGEKDVQELEDDLISISESGMYELANNKLSDIELDDMILKLRGLCLKTTGNSNRRYTKLLTSYENMKSERLLSEKGSIEALIGSRSEEIFFTLYTYLKEAGQLSMNLDDMNPKFRNQILCSLLSDRISRSRVLAEFERSEALLTLGKTKLSAQLLRYLSSEYRFNVLLDGQSFIHHDDLSNSIPLNIIMKFESDSTA